MLKEHPTATSFVCPDCDLTMKSQVFLELHQEMVHKSELNQVPRIEDVKRGREWKCPICTHAFTMVRIWKHIEGD